MYAVCKGRYGAPPPHALRCSGTGRREMCAPHSRLRRIMARSVHTDPIDIRAARRLAAPHAPRGLGDSRNWHRPGRGTTWHGASSHNPRQAPVRPTGRLRIVQHAPGDGHTHPAGYADIRQLMDTLPPRYWYKLPVIELRPAPPRRPRGALPLGRLLLPGRIVLYAQPHSPWLLAGLLADDERARLTRAGALLSVDWRSCLTVVEWPGHSLHDFMLLDVLLHELAHHALQVRRARSIMPAARKGDHEAVAAGLGRREARRLACPARERV